MTSPAMGMKRLFIPLFFLATIAITVSSCEKVNDTSPIDNPARYSSQVVEKWITLQVRLMKNTTGVPNQAFSRHYVYSGIAAFESVSPAMPQGWAMRSIWNGLTGLPEHRHDEKKYWPASVNASLAAMNRKFFPAASVADKSAIDSLENALNAEFAATASQEQIGAAAEFGKQVAQAVHAWAEADGYKNASAPYVAPLGPGLWVPTPPSFGPPASPYWGNNRPVIKGSISNSMPDAPVAYSNDPASPFYKMVQDVYTASQNLTQEQKNMALYWRDVPGVTSPGHWLNILLQVLQQKETGLEKAAMAYALTGAAINDGLIACWQAKYHFNLVRPVTFIRNEMGNTGWTPLLTTPGHPEYPSAHAVLSVAAADAFAHIFGEMSFTDHTYDYLGYPSRPFPSFRAIGEDASLSRFYAGIHYMPSIEAGMWQGKRIAQNIFLEKDIKNIIQNDGNVTK